MFKDIGKRSISPVGLGCMGMSEFYGDTDDNLSLQTLQTAYDLGYRHFDTADMYGRGHNENLLGKFLKNLKAKRDQVLIATKVGVKRDEHDKYRMIIDGSRKYVTEACDASLRRLGTDYIDLYYIHRRDPARPIEETVDAIGRLVDAGKVRAIGLCEVAIDTLDRAIATHPIAAVQSEYSLWTRDVEQTVLPACCARGIAFVAYSPLGRGFLTGKFTRDNLRNANPELDFRTKLPRFNDDNIEKNQQLVKSLQRLGQAMGASPSQIALAWILSKGDKVHAIPGTKKPSYLGENFASNNLKLDPAIVTQLDKIFSPSSISGERYPQDILEKSNN